MVSFKKFQIFSGGISWNNTRSDWAVKWLSLISIRSEQVSKIRSTVKSSPQPMHIGGSSPFSKKAWVIKEWPICNWAITVCSFLFVRGQITHSFKTGNIVCNLLSGNSSHSDCFGCNIYLLSRDFVWKWRMGSTQMSPARASLAAESAAELPLMPAWPGTRWRQYISHPWTNSYII